MDFSIWLAALEKLGFALVAFFLVWSAVWVIRWLLERNKELSNQVLKAVERNSEALESLKSTLDQRPCLHPDGRPRDSNKDGG